MNGKNPVLHIFCDLSSEYSYAMQICILREFYEIANRNTVPRVINYNFYRVINNYLTHILRCIMKAPLYTLLIVHIQQYFSLLVAVGRQKSMSSSDH